MNIFKLHKFTKIQDATCKDSEKSIVHILQAVKSIEPAALWL